jgi:anti-sigma B factor antagonist
VDEWPLFRIEQSWPIDDVALVVVEGELDIYTAPKLKDALGKAVDEGAERLIVDLSPMTFIDSTGLGVLVEALRRAQLHGALMDIVCSRPNVMRVFEVTGLLGIFSVRASREEALAAVDKAVPAD